MLRRVSRFLFEEEGFHGNTSDYYDPRNSFLNDVLRRYTGIPITLSILYIAVARRVGLPTYGVGLPGTLHRWLPRRERAYLPGSIS